MLLHEKPSEAEPNAFSVGFLTWLIFCGGWNDKLTFKRIFMTDLWLHECTKECVPPHGRMRLHTQEAPGCLINPVLKSHQRKLSTLKQWRREPLCISLPDSHSQTPFREGRFVWSLAFRWMMEGDPWDGGGGPRGKGLASFITYPSTPVFIATGPNISSNIFAVNYGASLYKKKKERKEIERMPPIILHACSRGDGRL